MTSYDRTFLQTAILPIVPVSGHDRAAMLYDLASFRVTFASDSDLVARIDAKTASVDAMRFPPPTALLKPDSKLRDEVEKLVDEAEAQPRVHNARLRAMGHLLSFSQNSRPVIDLVEKYLS